MADARQTKVVQCAKKYIGSKDWDKNVDKGSVLSDEYKCNLFVAEVLNEAGFEVPYTNKAGIKAMIRLISKLDFNFDRPLVAAQWYKGECPGTTLVGEGVNGLNKAWPGDIITNGVHVGIISGPKKTISATPSQGVVENDWGWRAGDIDSMKVFRYHP